MAKVVDITDKLSFETNPKLLIKGQEFEINADATTMLLIMGDFKNGTSEVEATLSAYERMFSEKERKKIAKLNLPFKDLLVVIDAAMNLIQGDDEPGEQ